VAVTVVEEVAEEVAAGLDSCEADRTLTGRWSAGFLWTEDEEEEEGGGLG
jgi:hypothetical protein